ncbi:MAG: PfkB family carbohydrate kinase [Bacteroidetes bacterium]|jgi:sugar/nucleoside kinase (ribokinase family)|nr:PfkB family carbohydrate kinase [Bacteroidota bacterium]
MSILVVGSVAFDKIETPFGQTDRIVGGAASYIALSAANFHQPVNLVGVVGGDFPQAFIEKLQQRGVDTRGLEIRTHEKSFFWHGRYHNDLNTRDTLETQLNVLETFDPQVPEAYRESEFLMLGNLMPDLQRSVIGQMKKRPKLIVMDTMNFWMDIAMDSVKQTIAQVDVLTINDEEARQLSGEYSLVKAARLIMKMGPRFVIIKKGEHGALLFHSDQVFYAPALPLEEVYDPTGAGDTFAGGFLGYLASTSDISFANMKNAIIYGSTMASFCVERFGTERLESLTLADIRGRYQAFLDLVQIEMQLV